MARNNSFSSSGPLAPDEDPFGGDFEGGGFMDVDSSDEEDAPQAPPSDGRFTVEDVKRAVVGSVGDVTTMAAKLGVDRVALRRYINAHPDIKEAIEDEILSAREQVMKQTFEDAINGSQPARADFFRMTGGMFDKKDEAGRETQQLIIQFSSKPKTFKALNSVTGETSLVNESLKPVMDADYESSDDDDDDDDEFEGAGGMEPAEDEDAI